MRFSIITIIFLLILIPVFVFGQQEVSQETVDDILEFAPAELIESLEEVKQFLEEENSTEQSSAQQSAGGQAMLPPPTTAFESSLQQVIIPSNNDFPVDIVWSANTFVPAGYKGKTLPVRGSMVKVVALTPTKNSSTLNYNWVVKDGSSSVQGADLKGIGENAFEIFAGRVSSNFNHVVEVIISNPVTEEAASGVVEIQTAQPEVHLYSNQNGKWEQAVNSTLLGFPASTLNVLAKPFYFNIANTGGLEFDWQFDSRRTSEIADPDILSLSITPETLPRTRKRIDLVVKNNNSPTNFFEQASVLTNLLITE